MKIALFSDIHANLPAFKAFLNDLDNRKPDAVYCLGDLIGYNVWPNEVVAEIRKRGIDTLMGNHDQKTKGYAYELVSADNRAYLNALPAHIKFQYQNINIVLAHGSTHSINEYVLEDLDENYVLEMMAEDGADMLCIGHSHLPYHRVIGNKHVINIGSVGKPKDGDPRAVMYCLTLQRLEILPPSSSVLIMILKKLPKPLKIALCLMSWLIDCVKHTSSYILYNSQSGT